MSIAAPFDGTILQINIWLGGALAQEGIANLEVDGSDVFSGGSRLIMAAASSSGVKDGLAVAVLQGQPIRINAEAVGAGGWAGQIKIQIIMADEFAMPYDLSLDGAFSTLDEKLIPISADKLLIEDSADAGVIKFIEIGSLPSGGAGAVASVNGQTGTVVLDPDDLSDTSTTNKFVSAAEKTKLSNTSGSNSGDETTATIKTKLSISTLSGSNTGDEDTASIKSKLGISTISGSNTGDETITTLGALINAATGKTTPVNADYFLLMDSAASNIAKKLSWQNHLATAKTYFDTLYQPILVSATNIKTVNGSSLLGSGDLVVSSGGETTTTFGSLVNGATTKSTPVAADQIPLMDSAASNITKKLSWTNLLATAKTYFDTLYQALLVSGTNIKTVNGSSLLGSGNLAITGGWTFVPKAANESRVNTTTLANDSALFFSMLANKAYAIEIVTPLYSSSSTPNIKFGFTAPTIVSGFCERTTVDNNNTRTITTGFGLPASSLAFNGLGWLRFFITYRTSAAGTFAFQWAQNTLDAVNSTNVLDGSYLQYKEI